MSAEYEFAERQAEQLERLIFGASALVEHLEGIEERTAAPYQLYAAAVLQGLCSKLDLQGAILLAHNPAALTHFADAVWKIAAEVCTAQARNLSSAPEGGGVCDCK